MVRCLVYAFLFLQVMFLVLSEEVDSSTVTMLNDAPTTLPTSVAPTRGSSPSSTTPPLIHNALNATDIAANTTMQNSTEKKNGASASYAHYHILMVPVFSAILYFSAILV